MNDPATKWFETLAKVVSRTIVTDNKLGVFTVEQGVRQLRDTMRRTRMTYMIGNGGSLAAAAHMAVDFNLAGLRSMALNDSITLTSHANDFGVQAMFTKQLEWYAQPNDVLIALSCSGKSANILDAASFAAALGMGVVTFSGFAPDNPLRSGAGELNFYAPAQQYGFVQLAHEAILHAACDIEAWHVPD